MEEIRLPALGENIDEVTIVRVLVGEGDDVSKDDVLVEIESDKATFEFPSPESGTIAEVAVSDGDTVKADALLFKLEKSAEEEEGRGEEEEEEEEPEEDKPRKKKKDDDDDDKQQQQQQQQKKKKKKKKKNGKKLKKRKEREEPEKEDEDDEPAAAGPAARRLARELGLDLGDIEGGGRGGRVREEDVLRAARTRLAASPRDREDGEELPDFSRWGEVEREPLNALRRTAARRLARAWREIPHVTQHEEARIETLEGELERRAGRKEPKITLTAVAVKAVAVTLREHPRFNSSYDKADESLVLKKYVHVGVAVDTERGLLVPVVRDAERKSLGAIAQDVARLAEKARAGDLGQDDMEGGTFTVTNLGGLGGTAFTPIVNPPQVAILGLARARDGRLPLSLSYDHRVIDGADAVRFVRHVAELLESPLELLAEA